MKTLIVLITLTLSSILVRAQSPEAANTAGTSITVTVPVQSNDALLLCLLFPPGNNSFDEILSISGDRTGSWSAQE